MAVYFIKACESALIKIGFAVNPHQRLNALQCGSPEPLALIAVMPGGAAEEAKLHGRFSAHRARGEWFKPSPDLDALIEAHQCEPAMALVPEPVSPAPGYGFEQVVYRIRRYAYDHGLRPGGLAAKSGLALNTLRSLNEPGWNPTRRVVERIEAIIPADYCATPDRCA